MPKNVQIVVFYLVIIYDVGLQRKQIGSEL